MPQLVYHPAIMTLMVIMKLMMMVMLMTVMMTMITSSGFIQSCATIFFCGGPAGQVQTGGFSFSNSASRTNRFLNSGLSAPTARLFLQSQRVMQAGAFPATHFISDALPTSHANFSPALRNPSRQTCTCVITHGIKNGIKLPGRNADAAARGRWFGAVSQ